MWYLPTAEPPHALDATPLCPFIAPLSLCDVSELGVKLLFLTNAKEKILTLGQKLEAGGNKWRYTALIFS